ncbi:hypothetical protein LSAT2_020868 [Lamellibrachia satsuma]|nr:hypothetical protein LSAT2_020868 [Lamellibrachia satsuma]
MLHRPLLIYRMQNLKVIDGIPVMDEERAKAEMYFTDLQPAAPISTTVEATLPGLGAYKTHVSMKVTNMQLVSYTDKMWSGGVCLSDDGATMQNQQEFQRGVARRRGYGRTEPLQGIQPITSKPPGTYTVPQFGHNKASPQQISQVNYLPQYHHNNDSDNK